MDAHLSVTNISFDRLLSIASRMTANEYIGIAVNRDIANGAEGADWYYLYCFNDPRLGNDVPTYLLGYFGPNSFDYPKAFHLTAFSLRAALVARRLINDDEVLISTADVERYERKESA